MQYRILILFFSLFVFSTISMAEETKKTTEKKVEQKKAKPKKKVPYYPKAKKAAILGKENYQPVNKSLKGLKAVYIDLDGYLKGAKSRKMKMPFNVKKKVIAILKKHNIKLIDKKSVKWKYGQPTIKISAMFPSFLGPYKKGEKKKSYNPSCCKAMLTASLTEGAKLLRSPDLNLRLTTWKTAQNTSDCSKLETWFPNAVVKVVQKFVNDKAKAEKKPVIKKKVIKKTTPPKKVVKKAVPKKPVIKKEKIVKKTVEKKVVTRPHVYAAHGNYAGTVKKVVTEKRVVQETKGVNVPNSTSVRTYARPAAQVVTQKVVEKVVPLQQVVEKTVVPERFTAVMTQKEVVCSNPQSSAYLGDHELYRKVVTYEKVVPQQVVVVQETPQVSICDKVITMDMEIFRTGSSVIDTSKQFMLNTLVNRMMTCQTNRYMIETNADKNGSHAYNDKLTKEREMYKCNYLQVKNKNAIG